MSKAPSFFAKQFSVSHETIAKLERYADLLVEWNPKINLVSPNTLPDLWQRHIADSAQLFSWLPQDYNRIADLGSGAGFPCLVLAIMGAKDVHSVESDLRKTIFQREVSRETNAGLTIHNKRIEEVAPLEADVVTARALAPLDRLVPWAYRHMKKAGGQMLFLKGAQLDEELAALSQNWDYDCERKTSLTAPDSAIVRLTHVKPKEHVA